MRPAAHALLPLALALALAGCADDASPAPTTTVEPPTGTSWATCPPTNSVPIMHPLRAAATDEPREEGIHRLDARTFQWVWRNFTETLHEDRLTRVNPVELARDGDGVLHLCTRADVSVPLEVDAEPRTYAVGLKISADADLPPGPVRVTVNWLAGCRCDELPRGNDTARFD